MTFFERQFEKLQPVPQAADADLDLAFVRKPDLQLLERRIRMSRHAGANGFVVRCELRLASRSAQTRRRLTGRSPTANDLGHVGYADQKHPRRRTDTRSCIDRRNHAFTQILGIGLAHRQFLAAIGTATKSQISPVGYPSNSAKRENALVVATAQTAQELDIAFATILIDRPDVLLMGSDPFLFQNSSRLIELALRHRIPTIYNNAEIVSAGGLISYGASILDAWRLCGTYAGRILKGSSPSDLPIIQPVKFELAVNLKTAKALGLTVPPTLLARADEVIE